MVKKITNKSSECRKRSQIKKHLALLDHQGHQLVLADRRDHFVLEGRVCLPVLVPRDIRPDLGDLAVPQGT